MTISERHKYILDKVSKYGIAYVNELSEELNVSSVTIRKDLKFLEEKKLLFKTHGSASSIDPYINDRSVVLKEGMQVEQKASIARKAVDLVAVDDTIIIASGTTVLQLAKSLGSIDRLTVITSSTNITVALTKFSNIEIVQLGGIVRRSSTSVIGHYAEQMLSNFACSKLFLGVDGIDIDFGLTTTNMQEAHLNQIMMTAAQKTIVLADSTKFGRKGFGKICDIDMVDIIITDSNVNRGLVEKIEERGVKVLIV
ncbi:DeoR/GlpR family DNA-binding transcription regulator [Alistipes sp. ZOR0009]|jgi:DeoR family transcriptional regulator of aga operon|uniref:DeoR/GlpR family DNA-binding transcription regulator n=1 Tax=Alistipes sp. ZOR0009 TaxID=1339253 RepID=UPI0006465786|nr:DeoR/GlpR family DNA-binding transcription regulator [Alistipes sp. ZOR0009]